MLALVAMAIVTPEARVPYPLRIFCNRNLRLDRIRHIGFDMDYTLAIYEEAMEHLQAEMALDRLVSKYGYPAAFLAARYEPGFAIRGLAVDKAHGNVFKMDSHRFVGRVWHGRGALEKDARRAIYTNRKLSPADPSIVMVDTLFSLPEISLYAQLVALVDAEAAQRVPSETPNYERLWRDLRESMDEIHRDGTLKTQILADIPRYIARDLHLAETLHRFRSAGKRLFLLTNSEPAYTNAVMHHLLHGAHQAYQSWRDYFDLVVTAARKPLFFSSEDPFFEVNADLSLQSEPATQLRRGGMFSGGNFLELSRLAGIVGDDVLYVGDHIYGDILRSKRATHWRTAMIIPEMDRELEHIQGHTAALAEMEAIERSAYQLELDRAALLRDGVRDHELNHQIKELTTRANALEDEVAHHMNPAWGQLFRDRAELSAFGAQVEDYACIYTSRVSNFRFYSPTFYFRSPRDRMAHELQP